MQKVPMTKRGWEELRAELDERKNTIRPHIIAAISEAREHGDLSENAEYHAAKEEQAKNEGRIRLLEGTLGAAEVIDTSTLKSDKIVFGATVTLMDEDTDEEMTYQIVGEYEADIEKKKIFINSPIARALIGKEEGDSVVIALPKGTKTYDITEVKYI